MDKLHAMIREEVIPAIRRELEEMPDLGALLQRRARVLSAFATLAAQVGVEMSEAERREHKMVIAARLSFERARHHATSRKASR